MINISDCAQRSERRLRKENQDRCLSVISRISPYGSRNVGVYVVCDGISHSNGGEAAKRAIQSLYASVGRIIGELSKADTLSDEAAMEERVILQAGMTQAILDADRLLRKWLNCGCTVSMAIAFDQCVYAANVGDSPIFLLRRNPEGNWKMEELYVNHNEAGEMVRRGEISSEEAVNAPEKNCLLRAVGVGEPLSQEDIPFLWADLEQESILLIGSDGALSALPMSRLEALTDRTESKGMERLCNAIFTEVEATPAATDNFTLIAARILMG